MTSSPTKADASFEDAYRLGQQWYVARLRSLAIEAGKKNDLTPVTRISTDRRVLEQLVAESVNSPVVPQQENAEPHLKLIAIFLLSAAAFVLVTWLQGHTGLNTATSLLLTIVTCAVAIYSTFVVVRNEFNQRDKSTLGMIDAHLKQSGFALPTFKSGDHLVQGIVEIIRSAAVKERTLFEFAASILLVADEQLCIICANSTSSSLLEYAPRELVGTPLTTLFKTEQKQFFEQVQDHAEANYEAEVTASTKSGEEKEFLLYTEWSKSQRLFFFELKDITEQKQLERSRQDFINMISHDLRSPLTSVQAVLYLFNSGAFGDMSEKAKRALGQTEANIDRLMLLLNDLLDAEQIRAGKLQLNFSLVRPADLIATSIRAFSHLAQAKNITVVSESTDIELSIVADGKRLTQVIVNLLSNALKFSDDRTTITLRCIAEDETARFEIQDQGSGIAPEHQAKLFSKFYRTSYARNRAQEGAGLGLSICKDIVEAHHGAIGVTSTPGEGSVFWFNVPRRPIDEH